MTRPLGDVAIVCGKDEQGLHILRRRSEDGPVEAGVLQPLTEGRPITGEVMSMRPRKDFPFLFDVKTELESPTATPARATHGPAQVASNSYRSVMTVAPSTAVNPPMPSTARRIASCPWPLKAPGGSA